MGEDALRMALVAAGRRLSDHGLVVAAEGNLSVRLPDGRILVTPSGRRKDALTPDDLLLVPSERSYGGGPVTTVGLRPSSDIAIHRAIYAARPDVLAVAHAHIPAAMALTLAGDVPDPAVLPETALFLPRMPLVPYETMGSAGLAARVAAALVAPPEPLAGAVLLERHGAIAVGDTIEAAVDRLDLVDVLCRTWRDARLLAPGRPLLPPRSTS
jgi:L-fuculose-phosphate aldolase